MLNKLLTIMQPITWIPNLLIFSALFFSGKFFKGVLFWPVFFAFVSVCLLSGCVRLFVEVGKSWVGRKTPSPYFDAVLSVNKAEFILFILFLSALVLGLYLNSTFGVVAIIYLFLMIAYYLFLYRIDILGALTPTVALSLLSWVGGEMIGYPLSPWLIIMSALVCFLLLLGKKRIETQDKTLDQMQNITSVVLIVVYILFTLFSQASLSKLTPLYFMATIPAVFYAVMRHFRLVLESPATPNATRMLLLDRSLVLSFLVWLILVFVIIYYL